MFWRLSVPIVKLYNMQLLNWRLVAIDQHTTMVRIWNSHRTRHVNLCFLKRLLNQWITVTAISVWCSITMHRWEGIKQRVVTPVQNLGKLYLKTAYPRGANGRLGVISLPSNIRLPKHQKLQVSFDQEIMTAAVSFFGCMPGGATACRIMKVTYGIQSRHVKELKARRCTERFQTYSNNFFRNH